ncbi:MAG: hypothetical protein IJQ12_05895, partial [Lachnospiraceae bacterium]|nr:hypothetical protein [Lachnospiraceae bacterium]
MTARSIAQSKTTPVRSGITSPRAPANSVKMKLSQSYITKMPPAAAGGITSSSVRVFPGQTCKTKENRLPGYKKTGFRGMIR